MNEYPYFNPHRKHHEILIGLVEKQLKTTAKEVGIYKFGDRTQHLFIDKKYMMTINWGLV